MNEELIDRCMKQGLADGVFPGAVLRVSVKGRPVFEKAYGVTDLQNGKTVDKATVFDLASLTKPLAGASALMILVQQGNVSLDSTVGRLIPAFGTTDKKNLTVRQLLCHTSGLPAYRPYYEKLAGVPRKERQAALRSMLLEEPLVYPPGEKTEYSDIGFMVLNWIIEACSGMFIDDFVRQEVFNPLGMTDLYYRGPGGPAEPGRVYASTEQCSWRKKTLVGEVHDQNAWIMDGRAAHAGLFGTAEGVGALLGEFLAVYHGERPGRVFHRSVVRMFFTECGRFRRSPGFDMPAGQGSSSGTRFSRKSVGHLGYTGTSFWMDLKRKIIVTLLTNRVHPSSGNIRIRTFRPLIHDTVMAQLESTGSGNL